jgi:hypothetical protein
LISFVTKYTTITEEQNGFRKNKSTETASQTFTERIRDVKDRWLHVTGIFFDLTMAYDIKYKIRGVTNLWFKSYFFNHAQFVEINYLDKTIIQNTYISPLREIRRGVPQGQFWDHYCFFCI